MVQIPVRFMAVAAISACLPACHLFHPGSGATAAVPVKKNDTNWRDIATDFDRGRLRQARAAWNEGLEEARRTNAADIAALGPLADPDVALDNPAPPPGPYRCRAIKLGSQSDSTLSFVAYNFFRCTIRPGPNGRLLFDKLDGSQRQHGIFWPDNRTAMVFIGTISLGDERSTIPYGADNQRNLIGTLNRVGPARWRIALPRPAWESDIDLVELVPAG